MKKNLFLLGTFMSGSLVAANTLTLIACQKKVSGNNTENEKDTIIVLKEIAAKLKVEIRNIIDDVITNSNVDSDDEWIIKLDDGYLNNNKEIIKNLNDAVKALKEKPEKDQQIALDKLSKLDSNLIENIKNKFLSLKDIIIRRINSLEDTLGISNFGFDLDSTNINLMLTALSGTQVMQAINKLNKWSTGYALPNNTLGFANAIIGDDIKDIVIDLFKVKTNLKYTFKFSDTTFADDYNDAELLLVGNIGDFEKINTYTQKTVRNMIANDENLKNIVVYGVASENKNYEYLGKQMDWDFSKQAVKDELKTIQYEKMNKLKNSTSEPDTIYNDIDVKAENFEFKIDPSNYVKFDNSSLNLLRQNENCILVCDGQVMNKEHVINKITEQFAFEDDSFKNWAGGKINSNFIKQVRKDSEGDNPIIDLSKYYGLEGKDPTDHFLLGYGITTLRKAYYSGIPLPVITIGTNLIAQYDPEITTLYFDFKQHVGTIIDAVINEEADYSVKKVGLKYVIGDTIFSENKPYPYHLLWSFGYKDEWNAIQNEITKLENHGTITFNWIMENILLKKRILEHPEKYPSFLKDDKISETAKTSLKTRNEIKYVNVKQKNETYSLIAKGYEEVEMVIYIKYGPFIVYLTGEDARATTFESDRNIGISLNWSSIYI